MTRTSDDSDLSPGPERGTSLTYFDREEGSWLPVFRGAMWGSACYFGLSFVLYSSGNVAHDIAMSFQRNEWAWMPEYRFIARAARGLAELILTIAAVASLWTRAGRLRFLKIAAIAVLVLASLSELAENLYFFNPWWWNQNRVSDMPMRAVEAFCFAATSLVVPLLLVSFLRRPEVRSLFR